MEQLLSLIATNFKETLVFFLLAALFFKESLVSYVNGVIGKQSKPEEKQEPKGDVHQVQIDGIKEDVKKINDDIKTIKDNHLFHIESDMVVVKEALAFIKGKLSK